MDITLFILAISFLSLLALYLWWNRSATYVSRAYAAFRKGNLPAVKSAFALAEAAGRMNLDATVSFAYLLLKDGEAEQAGVLLNRTLQFGRRGRALKTPQIRLVQTYRSLVLWKSGQLDAAVELLEGLLADGYRTLTLYGNLGYLLIEQKNWARAEVVCLEAAEWDSEGKVILDNLGYLYLCQEKWEQAGEVYARLLPLDPQFPEAWWNAGLVAVHQGDPVEARRLWEKALSLPFSALSTVEREEIERAVQGL